MIRLLYDYIIIKNSGLFDPINYLMCNVDVRRADIDPLWHFCTVGWMEGRKPVEWFDVTEYLRVNPDIQSKGINPFVDYIKNRAHGRVNFRG